MCPKQGLGFFEKIDELKANDKATFFSTAKWVPPGASARESEEKEFVVDSGTSVHMVSEKDLNEESDDGDDGKRREANKRRSHGICQRIGLLRESDASWRNTRSSFTGEALRGSWV